MFISFIRKLSYEVDQLLKDIQPEISPIGTEQVDNSKTHFLIEEEEKALQMRLMSQERSKSKLSTDLDSFLSQVQNMHSGFTAMKIASNGHKSPIMHHQLHVETHHDRSNSLDLLGESQTELLTSSSSHLTSRHRVSVVW